LFFNIKIPRGM